MSSDVKEQKQGLTQFLNGQEKKSLEEILSSYLKKQQIDKKLMKKMKKEFLDIKDDMKEAKTSFETLMNIQKKLSNIYKNLGKKENEIKKTKKNNENT
jgi:hypothetical protein